MKITLEQLKLVYGNSTEKEEINAKKLDIGLPKECRNCTLLEKDTTHRKVKCLYRTKEGCKLYGMGSR